MNNNNTLADWYNGIQKRMEVVLAMSGLMEHPVDKGDNSEDAWRNWLKEYLPQRYKCAKATVIDSEGNCSDQIDVVIYDAQYSYLAFKSFNTLYIPAESVFAVFEVKQHLTREYIKYAGKKAASVRKLKRTSQNIQQMGGWNAKKEVKEIIAGILTTEYGWKTHFGDAFTSAIFDANKEEQLNLGCALKEGAFSVDYTKQEIVTSTSDESLVHFFFTLLMKLQDMGNPPAIDLKAYSRDLKTDTIRLKKKEDADE